MDTPAEIDPLTRLAIKHGTDKWCQHVYTPVYHRLLSHLRDRPIRLLEIGTGGFWCETAGGASHAMWADYFPNASIVGIDIQEKRLDCGPRVTLLKGSQSDKEFLSRTCDRYGPFDIVIDDGGHVPSDVVTKLPGVVHAQGRWGIYVIEDVQTCFWLHFGGSVIDGGPHHGPGAVPARRHQSRGDQGGRASTENSATPRNAFARFTAIITCWCSKKATTATPPMPAISWPPGRGLCRERNRAGGRARTDA